MSHCQGVKLGSQVFCRSPGAPLDGVLFTVQELAAWGIRGTRLLRKAEDGQLRLIEARLAWDKIEPLHPVLRGGLVP